jgi:(E)-4-hydroxy-3-methylbut-2-enyl-diphosphate synthase
MKKTRVVSIGKVRIGGPYPIAVQSMCNTQTSDVAATLKQLRSLEKAGCEIVRLSVPDMQSVRALKEIKKHSGVPIVADIQFDYRLAIAAAPHVDKLRINPGNIGAKGLKEVAEVAKSHGIPLRIGVNAGSIDKDLLARFGHSPKAVFESVRNAVQILESCDFTNTVISAKMSDVKSTVAVYEMIAQKYRYPLHLGITEAGTLLDGGIKSALGIGILLNKNIGDTIRVSLTEDPIKEVEVGYSILQFLGLRATKREIVSCPTCSRTRVDLIGITKEIEQRTKGLRKPIKIAVMGCAVNGPGEAKNADVGVACGNKRAVIFRNGKRIRTVMEGDLINELMSQIEKITR